MFLPEELEAPVLIIDTNLGPTWGFVLVMSFISVALWGITCAQVYFYYSNYPKDAAYVRFTVIWLCLCSTTPTEPYSTELGGATYAALVDIIISCSLILYLRVKRVENASGRNKRMVRHLILLSLITGSWCAFNSLAVVMAFAIWPTNLVYFGIIIITSPVYCNTVLAHLNASNHFRALVSADPTDCPEDLEDLNFT
ncbi:hypothetical protein SERLADRAFT_433037 [Serpula lacrymans var. lacrymans S7.9]|uniref:DUF6534 domain-containing protein n=1 Tax=Serpula lacrymans var. lacrymans (strain S7.9) TaxID=578457 RepID=F8NIZ2_SERL9|nr:uncharacterized protein SERLADRAFT_433037 [Serpula lacrymans var. lacrymans S7.9]EGO29025.1 hypothetical protein SERLADRAFT_433037 [Serpula lacrymans var. lacrymans S7.9]